jgi:hypothetical protein
MGAGRWDADSRASYTSYTRSTVGKSTDQIFSQRELHADLDPKGKVRESRDSDVNPNSNAIIVAIDVTGSMGMIADVLARKGLGTIFEQLLDRVPQPISDPHLMFMALGDVKYDRVPLQVSQFEADNRIIGQLASIFVEHGGGGNATESYNLPWYFAAAHTKIDCFEKRGKKGYLFTVGDEDAPNNLTKAEIAKVLGDQAPIEELDNVRLLEAVQERYNVFHIVIKEGSHARHSLNTVKATWLPLLGQNVLFLDDHTKLAELVISTIERTEGRDHNEIVATWTDTSTRSAVHNALLGYNPPRPSLPPPGYGAGAR